LAPDISDYRWYITVAENLLSLSVVVVFGSGLL